MPAANTRKVEIGDQSVYLPEEDARLVELLREGSKLQAIVERHRQQLDEIKQEVAEIAEKRRGDRSTIHLTSQAGHVATVSWSRELTVDDSKAESLREVLGNQWGFVFQTRLRYTMAKGYRAWMNRPHHNAGYEKAKAEIAKAFHIVERRPSIKFIDAA